ncbi:hypothetical protein ACFQ4C_01595 [Larkinella insperata]|uniref:DUF4834 family protein n=1 Tax=Larkinella insperata TaxID=332158 RepID=A0ABW3PXC2_9BACT|nr:hypothetical protein [Larkinella insperata]
MTQLILIAIFLLAIMYIAIKYCIDSVLTERKVQFFAAEYEKALRENNKGYARAAGQFYYSALRRGKVTDRDEEAIKNDVALMKIEKFDFVQKNKEVVLPSEATMAA